MQLTTRVNIIGYKSQTLIYISNNH